MKTLPPATSSLVPVSRGEYQVAVPLDEDALPPSPLPIRRLWSFLLKFWWVPVLTLVLAAGAATAYLKNLPPTYISYASMWETVKLRLPDGALFTEDLQNFIGTQTELLRSARLQQLTLSQLEGASTNALPTDKDGQILPVKIKVAPVAKSSVFTLQASCADPAFAQAYLGTLMNVYFDYKKNIRKIVSGDTLASISEQVSRLERDLKYSQETLNAFQSTNNLAVLQEDATIAGGYLARLNTQSSDCRLEAQLLDAAAVADAAGAGTNLTVNPGPLNSLRGSGASAVPTDTQNAFQQIEILKLQRERLSKYLKPKHPKIVKLDAEIERGQKLVELFRTQTREQLASARQGLALRMDAIEASIQDWTNRVSFANKRIAEGDRLKQEVARNQSRYDRLQMLLQNVDISRNIDQETLAILQPATPALRSYKQELMVAALALCGGLGLGLGLVLLVAWRDDRFNSALDVNEKLGGGIVGQVPDMRPARRNQRLALVEIEDPRQVYAEAYRNLRSAILFMASEGQRPKTLLITSAAPDEGKSTITANLARTLALGGSRVLLVDGDLRKGVLHELLGTERGPGLVELLRGEAEVDAVVHNGSLPNLYFLSRGGPVSNPGDLFLGSALDRILPLLRERFDYILVDTSPVFAADDATTLAPRMDGTLFVVRNRFSRAGAVREALDLLFQRQAKVLGVIFNRVDASAGSYHYYKHRDYYRTANTV